MRETSAFLYPRVSSTRQEKEGNGLESQESRMRKMCMEKNWDVFGVYPDTVQGDVSFLDRAPMQRLLRDIDTLKKKYPDREYIVIFDDLKRLARDVIFYWNIRSELKERDVEVYCLNFKFEDTPEGEFIETVVVAAGKLEKCQNRRQVIQKMNEHIENGLFLGTPMYGYRVPTTQEIKDGARKALQIPTENAVFVDEAFDIMASGAFSLKDGLEYMIKKGMKGSRGGKMSLESFRAILHNPFYVYDKKAKKSWFKWSGKIYKNGLHKGRISPEIYTRVQDILEGRKIPRKTKHDYLLRKTIRCSCGRFLVPSKHKSHIYLGCKNLQCPKEYFVKGRIRKNLRADYVLETVLEAVSNLVIHSKVIDLLKSSFLPKLKREADSVLEKSKKAFEKQINDLEQRKLRIENAYERGGYSLEKYNERMADIEIELNEVYEIAKTNHKNIQASRYDEIKSFICIGQALSYRFSDLDLPVQRQNIELFFDRVEIVDGELFFEYSRLGKEIQKYKNENDNIEPSLILSQSGNNQLGMKKTDMVDMTVCTLNFLKRMNFYLQSHVSLSIKIQEISNAMDISI